MNAYTGADVLETMAEAINYNSFLEKLVHRYAVGQKILDFGAGSGQFAVPLRQKGYDVHCVEPDNHLAHRLKQKALTVYNEMQNTPRGFDTVYSFNVLEHIDDDGLAARLLIQHLRPGGRIIIYVPAFQILFSALDQKIGHHRRYTKHSLIKLFPELKIIDCRYVDSVGFFASLWLKFAATQEGPLSKKSVRFYDRYLFPVSLLLDAVFHPFFGKNVLFVGEKA